MPAGRPGVTVRLSRFLPGWLRWFPLWLLVGLTVGAAPLTTFDFRVVGTSLRPVPEVISVPRNLAGSLDLQFVRGDGTVDTVLGASLREARIEGSLRGPSYPAQRVLGEPGRPLVLPPLRVEGDYQLDDLRVVFADGSSLAADPSSVPVKVFDEVLVSHVTSRPLSLDEIRDKGIAIDESNFRAVEFDVVLVLQGKQFNVQFPVVAPAFKETTEIVPAAELEQRTVVADKINQLLLETVELPREVQVALPEFTARPIRFEEVGDGDGEEPRRPNIVGLLVIPGNIGFLNQFFSVQLYTENASPAGSGLTVNQLSATIRLPSGRDTNSPADDPLRLARLGPNREVRASLPVAQPGADGKPGTADDIGRLSPGQTGTAEFLVEGLLEGLHALTFDLEGSLEGLAAGPVRIRGSAAGSVLVRNATFSFTFSHPRTVRTGEPYEASVTLLNTSDFTQNLVSVGLTKTALSGTVLLSEARVELGNLRPGESATATFRFRSQRTGSVLFSNLTTGEDNVKGRLSLFAGVDERGVDLSPDSIGYPVWVADLPEEIRRAADRVLGQALSAVTAARLPEGVLRPTRAAVVARVLELAEAGQRLRYRDEPRRVLADLALDWQGARRFDGGFDQIVRMTEAGRHWRDALALALDDAAFVTSVARLGEMAPNYANGGHAWWLAAGPPDVRLAVGPLNSLHPTNLPPAAASYAAPRGGWLAARPDTNHVIRWQLPSSAARVEVAWLDVQPDGTARRVSWVLSNVLANAVYTFRPATEGTAVAPRIETPGGLLAGRVESFREEPTRPLTALQDISVGTDRSPQHCPMYPWFNWGTVVAVLFNKPLQPADVVAGAFTLPEGNGARTVQLQPGGRVALLQLHRGIGSFPPARPRAYELDVAAIRDPRGNPGVASRIDVDMAKANGSSVRGKVFGFDGQPLAGVPVTLTMMDPSGEHCLPGPYRAGQVFTDDGGNFTFDFVLADVPFRLAAVDITRLNDSGARDLLARLIDVMARDDSRRARLEELATHPETREAMLTAFNVGEVGMAVAAAEGLDRAVYDDAVGFGSPRDGGELNVVLRFRGRGTVAGRVLDERGAPVVGAAVNLFPDPDSRELGRGLFSDAAGRFEFPGVPLGAVSLEVATRDRRCRVVSERLLRSGQVLDLDVTVPDIPARLGRVRGQVIEVDGTPHPFATVYLSPDGAGAFVAQAQADAGGFYVTRDVPEGPWVAVAVSADGRRKGSRGVVVAADAVATANVDLGGVSRVKGIVRFWDGRPAAGARVGGGDRIVRADADGRFELEGVPTGLREFVAGLDGSETRDNITRTGSMETRIRPGANDEIEIRLGAYGRIRGTVRDGAGNPVPRVRVAVPLSRGFLWVNADASGQYEFNRMGLGSYFVSAPSPPVRLSPEELAAEALSALASAGTPAEVDAAAALVGQLANVYVQGSVGRLASTSFDPGSWGYASTEVRFDGDTATADIVYLPGGEVGGVVENAQGVPIGAELKVRSFGPTSSGAPGTKTLAGLLSDPSTGVWRAPGLIVGPYAVEATSPLLVGAAVAEGTLTRENPFQTNLVLRFPPQRQVTGRLVGFVFNPDGSPVTNGTVHISFASDYAIVIEEGRFDTQIRLPEGGYTVIATNDLTRAVGLSAARVTGGLTNYVTVRLLGQGSLAVQLERADGTPAADTHLELTRSEFPASVDAQGMPARLELDTDAAGVAVFHQLWEGPWSIRVPAQAGRNAEELQAGATVEIGKTNHVSLRLGAVGAIAGTVRELDTGLPVAGATVVARAAGPAGPIYATAPTDTSGAFELVGLPFGTYFVVAKHPVTGREAAAFAVVASDSATRNTTTVTLVEEALGEVRGTVFRGDGTTPARGLEVTWTGGRDGTTVRRVTTGPSGDFRFPAVPVGRFTLEATEHGRIQLSVRADGELAVSPDPVIANLVLPGLAELEITVLEPDGTPAVLASVFEPIEADTDARGQVRVAELRLGTHRVVARSRRDRQSNSRGEATIQLTRAGETGRMTIQLSGVGQLTGTLLTAENRPSANARVDFLPAIGAPRTTLTDSNGTFQLDDLPLGDWTVAAVQGSLAANTSGRFTENLRTAQVSLQLGASGSVTGTLVDEDDTELDGVDVLIEFDAPGGALGFARAVTGPRGRFTIPGLPIDTDLRCSVRVTELDGLAHRTLRLPSLNAIVDLGRFRLDQHPPELIAVAPADGDTEVSERVALSLTFSEPLDPASVTGGDGVWLLDGTTRVEAVLSTDPADADRRLLLRPSQPLRSRRTYQWVIPGDDRVRSAGAASSVGLRDRMGRPVRQTEMGRFTVRDSEPPVVLNSFPTNGAVEIEPAAVVRFEFDEPIDIKRVQVALFDASGIIAGQLDANPNQRLIAFVPLRPLVPNTLYRAELREVRDLSGNVLGPRTNVFTTLDNQPPRLAYVRLAAGQRPVANATVSLEAALEGAEEGATVEFFRGAASVGLATVGPGFAIGVRLPDLRPGELVTYAAVPIDRLGNRGEPRLVSLTLTANQPPAVLLARALGNAGPVATGGLLALQVTASDDARLREVIVESADGGTNRWTFRPDTNRLDEVVAVRISPGAVVDGPLLFRALVRDDSGVQSVSETLSVPLRDVTRPALAWALPESGARVDPRLPLGLAFSVRDNSARVTVTARLRLRGEFFEERTSVVTLTPNLALARQLEFDLSRATNGGGLDVELEVQDGAGNLELQNRSFVVRSLNAPRLVSAIGTMDGVNPVFFLPTTNRVSPWLRWLRFDFDKPVQSTRPVSEWVTVRTAAGNPVPFEFVVSGSTGWIGFSGPALPPGERLTVRLGGALEDAEGNPIRQSDGSPWPAGGLVWELDLAAFHGLGLAPGATAVPGQTLVFEVRHDAPFEGWQVTVGEVAGTGLGFTPTGTRLGVQVPTNATVARVQVRAAVSGRVPYELDPVELTLVPRFEDTDGDGLPNGWEADRSTPAGIVQTPFDPFDPSDAALDYDGDQLNNLAEYRRGTNPFLSDTDNDGLLDAAESAVREGCPSPVRADSDGDGRLDGGDGDPCDPTESLSLTPLVLTLNAGESHTNEIVVRGVNLQPVALGFTPGAPVPPWVRFTEFSASETNLLRRTLVFRPSFANVGEFSVPLTALGQVPGGSAAADFVLRVTVERTASAVTTRWKAPVDGDWQVPANWTAGVPGPGTNAVIDLPGTYTVTLAQSVEIESLFLGAGSGNGTQTLLQTGGTLDLNAASEIRPGGAWRQLGALAGQGDLAVRGDWTWEASAEVGGAGRIVIETGGRWRIEGDTSHSLLRSVLQRGDAWVSSQELVLLGPVEWQNEGVLEIATSPEVANLPQLWSLTGGRLVQRGTLRLVGADVTRFAGVAFEQRGTVEWTEGDWRLEGGGLNTARIEVPTNGRLDLSGTWTHSADSFLGGSGPIRFGVGTHRVDGLFAPATPVGFANATVSFARSTAVPLRLSASGSALSFAANQSFAAAALEFTSLGGAGALTFLERLEMAGGELLGPGPVRVDAAATATFLRSFVAIRCEFENLGLLEVAPPTEVWIADAPVLNRGKWVMSGRLDNSRGMVGIAALDPTPLRFVNEGELEVSGPGDIRVDSIPFDNRGQVTVAGSRLLLLGGGSNSGRIDLADATAVLQFGLGGLSAAVSFRHAATGTIAGPGPIELFGGVHEFQRDFTWRELRIAGSTILTGPAALVVSGRLEWSGGEVRLGGGLRVETGAVGTLAAGGSVWLGSVLDNRGTLVMAPGGSIQFDHGSFLNPGRLEIPGNARFDWGQGTAADNRLVNSGTLVKGAENVVFNRVAFENRGAFEFQAGNLTLDSTLHTTALVVPVGSRLACYASGDTLGFVQSETASLIGPGEFSFEVGSHDLAGVFRPEGPLSVSGALRVRSRLTNSAPTAVTGSLALDQGGVLTALDLAGNACTVGGPVEILDDLRWASGTLGGSGSIRVGPVGRWRVGGGFLPLAVRLETAGESIFLPGAGLFGTGGIWVNLPGAIARFEGDHSFSGTDSLIENRGTWTKSNAGDVQLAVAFENSGVVEWADGSLSIANGSQQRGELRVTPPAAIRFGAPQPHVFHPGVTVSGGGALTFSPFTAVELRSPLSLGSTEVTFEGDSTWIGNFPVSNSAGGLLTFLTGTWRSEGPLEVGGRMRVEAPAFVKLEGSLTLRPGARLVNLGARVNGESNIRVRPPQLWDPAQVEGIPPDVVPQPAPLRIDEIRWFPQPVAPAGVGLGASRPGWIRLRWREPDPAGARIETSTDLHRWTPVEATPTRTASGVVEVVVPALDGSSRFFRLRTPH